jgi:hypothetical protein
MNASFNLTDNDKDEQKRRRPRTGSKLFFKAGSVSKKQVLEPVFSKFVGKFVLWTATEIYHKNTPRAKRTIFFNIILLPSIKTANHLRKLPFCHKKHCHL